LNSGSGTIAFGATVTTSTGSGTSIANRTGGAVNLTGPITDTSTLGLGVSLTNNGGATITFSGGLSVSSGANTAFIATGGGTVNVTGAGNTLTTTGQAVNISGVAINTTFSSVSASGGTNGINIVNATGTFTAAGGAISGASGAGVSVDQNIVSVAYSGTVTSTSAARSVSVTNKTGGTVAFNGTVTDTGTGVSLTSNTGATTTFNGNLALTTGTNAAFTATGGGTVTVTGTNNTLATTTGTALLVANTTIGATGLKFTSITAGTATGSAGEGIILNNTGASGGLTVTGNGSAGSGGTIQHKTGADGDAANGIGIYLNSTASVSLNWMQLNDFDNFALFGSGVSGFALNNSVVNGTNGTNGATPYDEASVWFSQLTGAATLTGDTISGGRQDNVHVQNSSGTLSNLTIAGPNCAIQNNSTSTDGNTGITILASLTANVTTTISNCQFQGNRTDTIHTDAADTSTLNVTISGNTIVAGTGGNNQGNLGMEVTASQSAGVTFAVTNNKVGTPDDGTTKQPLINTGINIFRGSNAGISSGTVTGNIVIQDLASSNSGSGIIVNHSPTSTTSTSALYAKVDGNTVGGSESTYGIQVDSGGVTGATGNTQVQLTNNVVATGTATVPAQGAGALDAIRVGARRNTTACYRLSGNTASTAGSGFFGFYLRKDTAGTATMSIEGLASGTQSDATAIAYIGSTNTITGPGVGATAGNNYTGVANGSCTNIPA
ncbi:MAG: hypothetical protein M3Y58_05915, partial [Chloroflexota bacterium]|nr:hypothetical protein [Chloroflexota bacterium]